MGFADSLLSSYSQGYNQKLQASRAEEDRERQVRAEMAAAHAREIESDDTLTDEQKRDKLREIFNVVGNDTGYKHDPKIFGIFHPQQPGHKGTAMGDALFGPGGPGHAAVAPGATSQQQVQAAAALQPPPGAAMPQDDGMTAGGAAAAAQQRGNALVNAQTSQPQPYVVAGTPGRGGTSPALAGPTSIAPQLEGAGRQVILQPPPQAATQAQGQGQGTSPSPWQLPPQATGPYYGSPMGDMHGADGMTFRPDGGAAIAQPGGGFRTQYPGQQPTPNSPSQLQPPPVEKTLYPPGYTPDTSSKAGRKEAAQVRSWWVEHQGQVDLLKQEALDKGYTEKASIAFDPEKNETVTTFVRPADGAQMEVRTQGVPPNVQAAYARINAQNERKVNQEVAILRRLPENAGKSDEELQQAAAQNLAGRQDVIDKIKAGTLKWQGGDLTKLIEAHKTLSDPNASEDERAGARSYIDFRNAALEANKARAVYFSTAGDREEMRQATQAIGAVNRVRPLFVKANSDAKSLEEQADAAEAEAQSFSTKGVYTNNDGEQKRAKWAVEREEAAREKAAGLRAKATAARERADSFKNDLIGAGANAEAFPRSVQVVWGGDGLPSVKRLATPSAGGAGGGGARKLTPPPSSSSTSSSSSSEAPASSAAGASGRFAGQRMSRANLPAAARQLGVSTDEAERIITREGGVIY